MSNSTSEEEILMYQLHDGWDASSESIITQQLGSLAKSESSFLPSYNPSLTYSQLELRELRLKNLKEKAQRLEGQNKGKFFRVIHTRSLMRDELDILKINMSVDEKASALRESQILEEGKNRKGKRKSGRKLAKLMSNSTHLQRFGSSRVKDFLAEIEDSEAAKTDKVSWKFLKRSHSSRKDAIAAKKFVLQVQTLYLPVLELLSDSHFLTTQPIKITCPNCRFFITTQVKKISTLKTKLTSLLVAIIRVCLVPYNYFGFSHSVHLCPLCKIYLGFTPALNFRVKKKHYLKSSSQRED